MPTYKDINLLTQKATIAGTEKIPVSDTEYVTTTQIASLQDITGKQDVIDSSHKLAYELIDTSALQQKSSVDGTEEIPVSGTEYITPTQTVIGGSEQTVLTPDEVVEGARYETNGTTTSADSYQYWKFHVTPLKRYLFSGDFGSTVSSGTYFVIWLDKSGTVVSYSYHANYGSTVRYRNQVVTAPINAAYMIFNVQTYYESSASVKAIGEIPPTKTSDLYNDSGFKKITISSSEPTSSDGSNGDIWIVI